MPAAPRRTLVAVLLALLLAAPPARAEDTRAALRTFAESLKAEGWKDRRDAYAVLAGYDGPGVAQAMLDAMAEEANPAVVLEGVRTLGQLRSSDSKATLVETLRRGRGQRRLHALLALEAQKGSESEAALLEALGDKESVVVAQAALALGARRVEAALPRLLAHLAHGEWQVRVAAARAILALASPPAPAATPGQEPPPPPPVPDALKAPEVSAALLAALEKGRGRERTDLVLALERIQGVALGDDPEAWAQHLAGTPVDPATRAGRPQGAHAFGIPIRGQRVVFVLDNSIRAGDPHNFGLGERMEEVCRVPGGPPILSSRLQTSGLFARAHLLRCMKDLDPQTRVNLLVFNAQVRPLFEKPVSASAGNRKAMADALDGLEVDDGVATFDALSAALDLWGAKESVAWDKGPDEIVFVTFNAPTAGEITEPDVVAAAIALKARLRLVTIHTVGVTEHAYDMCAQIARETGGVYRNYYE
jgi:hypothetical protein